MSKLLNCTKNYRNLKMKNDCIFIPVKFLTIPQHFSSFWSFCRLLSNKTISILKIENRIVITTIQNFIKHFNYENNSIRNTKKNYFHSNLNSTLYFPSLHRSCMYPKSTLCTVINVFQNQMKSTNGKHIKFINLLINFFSFFNLK